MRNPAQWVRIRSYPSMLEAELGVQTLDAADIPAVTRSHELAGVFGSAFQGSVPRGVDLLVPSPMVDEARTTLGIGEQGVADGDNR